MLSNYYFLGLGNDTEGCSILSGQNLETAFLFTDYYISVNQFLSFGYFNCPIFYIKENGQQISGRFNNVNQFSENLTTDVNAVFKGLYTRQSNTGQPYERFNKKESFILSASINGLIKTSNYLFKPDADFTSQYPIFRNNVFQLLVKPEHIDLSIVEAKTNNIYEYFDYFNITSIDDALTGTTWRDWRATDLNFPISNYGTDLSVSSTIYKFNSSNTINPPFFGISGNFSYSNSNYTEDLYKGTYTYTPDTSYSTYSYCQYINELSGFTFYDQAYSLSGVNNVNYATLYKKGDKYIPLKYNTLSKLCDDNINFYISSFGRFEVLSGEAGYYINKMHNYFTSQNIYKFGEWLSGLQYVSTFGSNVSGVNFNIGLKPRSQANDIGYLDLIGFQPRYYSYHENYYETSNVAKSIQGTNTQEFYIAIDPQTYTISL